MSANNRIASRRAVKAELSQAEAKILQMQKDLCDMYIRQRLNDITLIIYNLPADVIIDIFQHLLPNAKLNDSEPIEYGCSKLPVQLCRGAVCWTWRSIAWLFTGLWKRLHFTFDEEYGENQVDLVQDWTQRSGKLPLDISLAHGTGHLCVGSHSSCSLIGLREMAHPRS